MESGIMMVLHSLIIGIILYIVLFYGLKQSAHVAEDRSVLIAALVLVYMVLFGHRLPTKINKNIL